MRIEQSLRKRFVLALILTILLAWLWSYQIVQAVPEEETGNPPEPRAISTTIGTVFRYVHTFGVSEEAYPSSTDYLNRPGGIFIDGSDNLFVTEEKGCRLLKYSSGGAHLLSIGTAGLCYTDDVHFGSPRDVAIDAGGNIWVADQWSRVVQYDASGNFLQNLPETNPWETGTDNTHFKCCLRQCRAYVRGRCRQPSSPGIFVFRRGTGL